MSSFEVIVSLKPEVLDTTARAISSNLQRLGYSDLKDLTVSKRFVLNFADSDSNPAQAAEKIAAEVLANPVSEIYELRQLS